MTSSNELIALLSLAAVFCGLRLYDKYGPLLSVKRSFTKHLGRPAVLLKCTPADNRDYDATSFQAFEKALGNSGFSKLGEGELFTQGQSPIPSFFMFFGNPSMNCVGIVRQVFPTHGPNPGVQISIGTRMENGSHIITRSHQTYADLTLPNELVEIVSSRSPGKIIQHHFQRLSMVRPAKALPAPTTLEGCLNLVNERRARQVQALQQKTTLSMARSFFKRRQHR